MTDGLPVLACERCGRVVFPERQLCPACGSSEWRRTTVSGGVLAGETTLRRAPGGVAAPVRIGTVILDGGPPVVARLLPGAAAGDRILLACDDGVPVARPFG